MLIANPRHAETNRLVQMPANLCTIFGKGAFMPIHTEKDHTHPAIDDLYSTQSSAHALPKYRMRGELTEPHAAYSLARPARGRRQGREQAQYRDRPGSYLLEDVRVLLRC